MIEHIRILTLDAYGTPAQWSSLEKFAYHQAKGNILWTLGAEQTMLRGGFNRDGIQSTMTVPSIIAVKGLVNQKRRSTIQLNRDALAQRDRCTCAYCGRKFHKDDLRMEHVHPKARGGKLIWMNVVATCEPCNSRKACRTPEEANMPLLYLPYIPDRNEGMIMRNRNILADQMNFLMAGVHKNSRLHLK